MDLFELIDYNVSISPQAIAITAFKKLWDRDKKKDKRRAIAELSYVFFTCDYKSIYRNYARDERIEMIKADVGLDDKWQPDKTVEEAVEKYKELHYTASMKMLDATEIAFEKMRKYFEDIDLTLMDERGKLIYNARDLRANMEAVPKLIQSQKKIREEVEKEQAEGSTIRGGGDVGMFENPDRGVS